MIFQVPATSEGNNPISSLYMLYLETLIIRLLWTPASPFIGGGRKDTREAYGKFTMLFCFPINRVKINGIHYHRNDF
jgi:hypothetical protein